MRKALLGCRIFDGFSFHEASALLVDDTQIAGIVERDSIPEGFAQVELDGGLLVPGLVDLQVNGGGGIMFNDAPSVEALETMARAHMSLGTTALLPTLISDTPEVTRAAIDATVEAIGRGVPGVFGLHLEGPHLSLARKGAHDPSLIRRMTATDERLLKDAAQRLPVLFVTVAPENVTDEQIRRLADAGVIISLGHSDCSFAAACSSIDHGARCVTHLFNAMSQIGNREPGLVGAALGRSGVAAGLIADLIHVHPEVIRIALSSKAGDRQVFLVSDAMAPAGTTLAEFTLNDRTIQRAGGRLTLADGTLAGADLDLPTAIGNLIGLGVPQNGAISMATSVPAEVAGVSNTIGTLQKGSGADMVHLDDQGRPHCIWHRGKLQREHPF